MGPTLHVAGGRVVVDPALPVLPEATGVVRGGRIERVVPAGEPAPPADGARGLDAWGLTVVPGLISTPAHLTVALP